MLALGVLSVLGYVGYANFRLKEEKTALGEELAKTKAEFAATSQDLLEKIEVLKVILAANQSDRNNLQQDLLAEREAVDAIEAQVQAMTGTVGVLKKLSDTEQGSRLPRV